MKPHTGGNICSATTDDANHDPIVNGDINSVCLAVRSNGDALPVDHDWPDNTADRLSCIFAASLCLPKQSRPSR